MLQVAVNHSCQEEPFIKQYNLSFQFTIPNTTSNKKILKLVKKKCIHRFYTNPLFQGDKFTLIKQFQQWKICIKDIKSIKNDKYSSKAAADTLLNINALPNPLCLEVAEYFVHQAPFYAMICETLRELPYIWHDIREQTYDTYANAFRVAVAKPLIKRHGMSRIVESQIESVTNANGELERQNCRCNFLTTRQKDILRGIENDSLEWNDFDGTIFQFCDLWLKMFEENIFSLCCAGIASYVRVRSHVRKLYADRCLPNKHFVINNNINVNLIDAKINTTNKSKYQSFADFECSISQLIEICHHLQYILKNNCYYNHSYSNIGCLPCDIINVNVDIERNSSPILNRMVKKELDGVIMAFTLFKELNMVFRMFEHGIRIFIRGCKWLSCDENDDDTPPWMTVSSPYHFDPGFTDQIFDCNSKGDHAEEYQRCSYSYDYNCQHDAGARDESYSVHTRFFMTVGNLDNIARKYDEILDILFSTPMKYTFGNNYKCCLIEIEDFLEYFLQMLFVLIEFATDFYLFNIVAIKKMECVLKIVVSKHLIFENMNEFNVEIFDLYYAILLKLRLKRIKFDTNCDNKKNIIILINEVKPYYDHFLGNSCTKRKNISGKYWGYIVNDLIWIEFLIGKLSIGSKYNYVNKAECIHSINKARIYHNRGASKHGEKVRKLLARNPEHMQMVQLYPKQNFNLNLIHKPRYLKSRFEVMLNESSMFSSKIELENISQNRKYLECQSYPPTFDLVESVGVLAYRLGLIKDIHPQYLENAKQKNYKDFYFLVKNIIKAAKSKNGYVNSCKQCQCECRQLKRCKGCYKIYYCSRKCQKKHWCQHRLVCSNVRV